MLSPNVVYGVKGKERHEVMVPRRVREFVVSVATMFSREISEANRATKTQIQQLAGAIIEHGRMASQLYSRQPVGVEVKELAFRFREKPHNILTALILLEGEGQANRTRYEGYWMLRVQPQKKNNEVSKSHEEQRRA
jgi:hypothetical protein